MSLDAESIERLKERFSPGSLVRGVFEHHAPFGYFVDLGIAEAIGLVRIIDIVNERRPLTKADFPPVGSKIRAYVWGLEFGCSAHPYERAQVTLSIKPSLLETT